MPGRYLVVNDGRLVIVRWVGTISHAEALSQQEQRLEDASIAEGAKGLANFPDDQMDLVVESAEECPGECIYIEP